MGFAAAFSMCRQTFHHKRSHFPTPFIGIEVKRAKVELRHCLKSAQRPLPWLYCRGYEHPRTVSYRYD